MDKQDLSYWLVLNRCSGIGAKKIQPLCSKGRKLKDWFQGEQPTQAFREWYAATLGKPLGTLDWAGVERDLAWAQKSDCTLLTLADEAYPKRLKEIASPPLLLFVQGDVALLDEPQIGMVGSRKPTPQGRQDAFDFAQQLSQWGLIVTSGLALGIDGACHEGVLSVGNSTIAILGSGLTNIYPKEHLSCAHRILEKGALVSEIPIGFPPKKEHFPRRNRIISGLSLGVVVVEAAKKSGSLITANYALEQGREVFALPGSIHNPMAKGCHALLRQGATCVEHPSQIVETLAPILTHLSGNASMNSEGSVSQRPNQTALEEEIHSQPQDPIETKLLGAIADSCTPIDVIVEQTGLPPQQVSCLLLSLELKGSVRTVPGGVIRLHNG